ncbi:uncharacterized protein LOC129902193 isoform X3 [Solanum dulcamara]|uniref:uncharacterized protein LOC129902193 isoform X3 n=1 Tax=Solanum dulcamara TaxID=45834 RepID=UPI00248665EC|nr:uncharacterized protein LOC129902193 isoform X3 [Solanum dulcamara]
MDLWSLHVKNTNLLFRNSISEKPFVSGYLKSVRVENWKVFEIRLPKRQAFSGSGYHSLLVKAMGKKNSDNSNSSSSSGKGPEEDNLKGSNPSSGNDSSKNTGAQKSHQKPLDWREFRASLYIQQVANAVSDTPKQEGTSFGPKALPLKWAHPISAPENGCVLVATEKLDGVRTFERTVVFLLRSGTRHPQEGPFGVVINHPLGKKIEDMKPTNLDLATTFADCSLHFGGPLEASMFLLRSGAGSELPRFEEVIPGVCYGARNSLEEASALVNKGVLKPDDFRFFVGYAGWQLDQLREEIESGYWYVASCSANLIFAGSQTSSSKSMWGEILQLMGGQYLEVSRKPKQDI